MLTVEAAIGYMMLSAKEMNLDEKIIQKLKTTMRENIEIFVEQIAENEYYNFKEGK